MISKTSLSSCFALGAGLLASASPAAAQGAESATAMTGNGAGVVLGAVLVGIALELRRRVQASMWASRDRAFTRRTLRAQRQQRSGRTR